MLYDEYGNNIFFYISDMLFDSKNIPSVMVINL